MKATDNTVIIFASGPSLTRDDCIRAKKTGARIISVNSSWGMVPDCDYIFAADHRWWEVNINLLPTGPQRWSNNLRAASAFKLQHCPIQAGGTFNSGQLAIHFAAWLGAKNIILLGFDCSVRDGIHWHGKHISLPNPGQLQAERWKREFKRTAGELCGKVNIVNCSGRTELDCFDCMLLDDALNIFT
jgi:hypothetical protein